MTWCTLTDGARHNLRLDDRAAAVGYRAVDIEFQPDCGDKALGDVSISKPYVTSRYIGSGSESESVHCKIEVATVLAISGRLLSSINNPGSFDETGKNIKFVLTSLVHTGIEADGTTEAVAAFRCSLLSNAARFVLA